MKTIKKLLFIISTILLVIAYQGEVFATDAVNDTVYVIEDKDKVTFFGKAEFTGVTTDDKYTYAFAVVGGDWFNASFYVYGNAEAGIDVDVFLQGSPKLSSTETDWANGFIHAGLAAVGAAQAVIVAIGQDSTVTGEARTDPVCKQHYQRLRFDGQTGNPAEANLYWYLVVPKTDKSPSRNAYGIFETS